MVTFNLKPLAAKLFTPGIKKFSNLHKGESCYLFGNGESIKWFDLSLFGDHPAVGCNMLPFHKDFHKLDVRYMTLVEPWYFTSKLLQPKRYHESRAISAEYKKIIRVTPDIEYFVSLSNKFSFSGSNVNYVFRGFPEIRNKTDELLSQFDLFGGGFHATLSLAYYLGFSKIYLVGFDSWVALPQYNLRFCELGKGVASNNVPPAESLLYMNIIERETDLCAITLDGQTCHVEGISYEKYTGKSPVFKENYEIINDDYLKLLASNSYYKVYPS